MSEQIPYSVASGLINTLASLAFSEFGLIYGVRDELERLKNTVESIKAVLLDAEEKQEKHEAVRVWIRRLKNVLHAADDLLDEFATEDLRHKVYGGKKTVKQVRRFFSSSNQIAFRSKIAHEIRKIRQNFNDVVGEMSRLNLNSRAVEIKENESSWRETGSYVVESNIIGREDSKKEIVNLLKQPHGNQNVSVIAIVGIGGLGKTTVAQLVYNDLEVQNFFEKRMWVCVSDEFDVKTIVRKILELLISQKLDELSLDYLQNKFRENLSGKRYLLVLDDAWNENDHESWTELRDYLTCGALDSKILVTTRSIIVAQTMGVKVLYVLKGLTAKESWSLLKKIVFGGEAVGMNLALESVGGKIAQKCRGVPLAIRTMGGMLQGKNEESEWIHVLNGDVWKFCQDKRSIMPILKLSYQNLPHELRQCFVYCSLYPKDREIEKDELIQLWMAQGYLQCSIKNQTMEDMGNQFVRILLMKSFFQDAEIDQYGDIINFKMHDLMHDLATSVAGDDFYLYSEGKRLVGSPMHVSVEKNSNINLLESLDASKVRTFWWLWNDERQLSKKELSIISSFKCLRVLKLHFSSNKLSNSIGELKHLRYLQLLGCYKLTSLPKSTCNLINLQTLKLNGRVNVAVPIKVVCSKSFQGMVPARSAKLSSFEHLSNLVLGWNGHHRFSNSISSLINIVEISLSSCRNLQYLPPLERLPSLKSLHMEDLGGLECIYFEEVSPTAITFFPSLETLIIKDCFKLRGWQRMGDDVSDTECPHHLSLPPFPRLSQLQIRGCKMLTCMPAFPSLVKGLEFRYCSTVKPLAETLNKAASTSSSPSFTPLSMLKSLYIDKTFDIGDLPVGWMQNLTSLDHLTIANFHGGALQELEIWFMGNLDCLPSLKTITVQFCDGTENLPDWVCNFPLLQHIKILDCLVMASLPEKMPRLTDLQKLEIVECPRLLERCQRETGAEWHKIAHIPNIVLQEEADHQDYKEMF